MDSICNQLMAAHKQGALLEEIEKELYSIVGSYEKIQRINNDTISSVLPAERGDGTEGLLLMAPSLTLNGTFNYCGIAYALASLRQYRRWNFWARDFVVVFPGLECTSHKEMVESVESWLQAYHAIKDGFTGHSGAIQAGVVIELDGDQCGAAFADADLCVEGPNGLLPNLDLVNSFLTIDRHRAGQMRVFAKSSKLLKFLGLFEDNEYISSLLHLAIMMFRQAFGWPLHSHGPLLKYRIDAITIKFYQVDRDDTTEFMDRNLFEYTIAFALVLFCRQVELGFRSLNNILEHLHQSFFFYLLPDRERFISIANYIGLGVLPIVALLTAVLLISTVSFQQLKRSLALLISFFIIQFSILRLVVCLWKTSRLSSFIVLFFSLCLELIATEFCQIPAQTRLILSFVAALSLTPLLFLNFSLSVFLGIIYGPLISLGGASRISRIASLAISPNSLLLLGLAIGLEGASNLMPSKLLLWNAGIPFVVWQSLLAISIFPSEE